MKNELEKCHTVWLLSPWHTILINVCKVSTFKILLFQKPKKTFSSCENRADLLLCPIRIGLGKSSIKAIGNQVQKGELAAWNSEGWCGLSHDILEIDFGQEFDIQLIKVKKVLSSPAPEYVKLGMGSNIYRLHCIYFDSNYLKK